MDYIALLEPALEQAQIGFDEGGVPVGAAMFSAEGALLSVGRNRRVQESDPSIHGETDAFRKAGRQQTYRDKVLVTTLAPCWYCSGLIRQFNIGTVVVGESVNFSGHLDWLIEAGVKVVELNDARCIELMARFIENRPDIWNEDIGECDCAAID
ncbi:tRNA-specific adenosine deaminase [Hydrogenovibrio sp. SC-1]|uniref:nucleoside deaminase n=1 Tax=Hydrogenovibrio sp. SC-1 TaxID=2065820 RepID=UPI000C7B4438|nr:nucleoside deaminase [Hydrogenovibrio sp. SC-1]PLA73619.1 tRNA-specific adenosine deaminase [Hydrogenovibrio sp. SC-1]